MPKYNIKMTAEVVFEGEVDTDDLTDFEGNTADPAEVSEYLEQGLSNITSPDELSETPGTLSFSKIKTNTIELSDEEE